MGVRRRDSSLRHTSADGTGAEGSVSANSSPPADDERGKSPKRQATTEFPLARIADRIALS